MKRGDQEEEQGTKLGKRHSGYASRSVHGGWRKLVTAAVFFIFREGERERERGGDDASFRFGSDGKSERVGTRERSFTGEKNGEEYKEPEMIQAIGSVKINHSRLIQGIVGILKVEENDKKKNRFFSS
jgi:hypothetical protein